MLIGVVLRGRLENDFGCTVLCYAPGVTICMYVCIYIYIYIYVVGLYVLMKTT